MKKSGCRDTTTAQGGFTIVELLLACVIFPMMVYGLTNVFTTLRHSYMTARQLNQMYAVLSACPEIDRALEFSSLSSSTNCYPNNSFQAENGSNTIINYAPALTVTDTAGLAGTDALSTIPDSKVIDIKVNPPTNSSANANLELRMLITRNGIGQL
jgi:Tfp pilus assembly protein PilV